MALASCRCILLAIFFTVLTNALDDTVICTINDDDSVTTNCTVLHNQNLVLNCSQFTYYTWYKNTSSSTQLCSSSICTLSPKDIGFIETSGLYYCTLGRGQKKHFVNVQALGPPEYARVDGRSVTCHGLDNCHYEFIWFIVKIGELIDKTLNISVKVVGRGPFTISWHINSTNATANDACNDDGVTCHKYQLSETEYIFSYLMTFDKPIFQISRMYTNVSNLYGYNVSETGFQIKCDSNPSNTLLSPTTSRNLTLYTDDPLDITCSMNTNQLNTLGLCYFPKDWTINDILSNQTLLDSNCGVCPPTNTSQIPTKCYYQIPSRPSWQVYSYVSKFTTDISGCTTNHTIKLHINSLSESSDGYKFQCYYHSANVRGTKSFQNWYQIEIRERSHSIWQELPWLLATVVGVVVTLVVMVTIVMVTRYWLKRRKKRIRNQEDKLTSVGSQGTDDSGIETDRYYHHGRDNLSSLSVDALLPNEHNTHYICDYGTLIAPGDYAVQLDPTSNSRTHLI